MLRENEEEELADDSRKSPGPGSYLDIYKTSCFKVKKSTVESMSVAVGRFNDKTDSQTLLAN